MSTTYNIELMVSDGTHTSTATLTINLTDVNDNAPVFGSSFYIGSVAENSASGKIICIVVIKTRVENILLKKSRTDETEMENL